MLVVDQVDGAVPIRERLQQIVAQVDLPCDFLLASELGVALRNRVNVSVDPAVEDASSRTEVQTQSHAKLERCHIYTTDNRFRGPCARIDERPAVAR